MTLAAITYYCTQSDIEAVLSINGVQLRLDDSQSGSVSGTELGYLTLVRGWASQTCEMYLADRYAPSYLATSPLVNKWATDLAAYELCFRRGNAVPEPIQVTAEHSEEQLKNVYDGRMRLPGIPMRRRQAPSFSNTRFDARFTYRCIRVEKGTSSPIQSKLPQIVDYQAAFWVEL